MNAKKYMYGMIRACSIVAIASVLGGVSYSAMADEPATASLQDADGTRGSWLGRNESKKAEVKGKTYSNKTASAQGAGITNFSGAGLDIIDSFFIGNKVTGKYQDTDRQSNSSIDGGGALFLGSISKTNVKHSTFRNNSSTADGGAIATRYDNGSSNNAVPGKENSTAELKVENSTFTGNSAEHYGGAIHNTFDKFTATGNTFTGNSAAFGGAVFNEGGRKTGSGENNQPTLKGSTFTNNRATATAGAGGAVYNSADGQLDLEGTTFVGNHAEFGGAVSNSAQLSGTKAGEITSLKGATFSGNTAGQGGAIWNKGTIKDLSGTFENNSATRNAGAIMNGDGDSTITFAENGTTTFTGNRSGAEGGAISNNGSITFNGDITFANNSAAGNGGAISNNNGTLTFASGTTTFTGNTAGGVKNDIFNNGNIKIGNGTDGEGNTAEVILDGGIAGNGELTVEKGGILDIGTSTVSQKNIHLVNGAEVHFTLQDHNNFGKLIASEDGEIKGGKEGDATVYIDYIGEAGEYQIFTGKIDETERKFSTKVNGVSDKIFNKIDVDLTDDKVKFAVKDASELATSLTGATGSTIGSIRAVAQNERLSKVSIAMQKVLNEMATGEEADYSAASAYIDREVSGAKSHQSPIVHALTTQLQHQALNLAQNRMDTRIDQNTPANVWADGSLNWSKYNGGFKGRDASIAAGADFAVDNAVRVGLGYAYNQGSMWESNRDIDIDSHTLMAYAQYKPADWFVNGTVSYSMSELDESIDMLGLELGGKHDVDALGMSLMGGYDLAYGLTPTVGVRYLHINGDDWDNGAMKVKMDSYDFVTGVLGLRYAQTVFDMNGWKFTPDVNIAATYDIVSDDMHSDVAWYGAAAEQVGLGRLSRAGMEAGVNLGVTYYGLGMSLGYNIDVRNHYVSHTGMLKFKYEF